MTPEPMAPLVAALRACACVIGDVRAELAPLHRSSDALRVAVAEALLVFGAAALRVTCAVGRVAATVAAAAAVDRLVTGAAVTTGARVGVEARGEVVAGARVAAV